MVQEICIEENHVQVNLSGSMYVAEAALLRENLVDHIAQGHKNFIIDLGAVDYIDSSGLGTLVSLMKMMNGKGEMTLCALNPGIRNMFTLTRMDRIFRICEDRTSALAQFNP